MLLAKQIWLRIDCCERQTQFGVIPLRGLGFWKQPPWGDPSFGNIFLTSGQRIRFFWHNFGCPPGGAKLWFPTPWSLPAIFEVDCGRIVKFECKRTIWSKSDFGGHPIWDPNTSTGYDARRWKICESYNARSENSKVGFTTGDYSNGFLDFKNFRELQHAQCCCVSYKSEICRMFERSFVI